MNEYKKLKPLFPQECESIVEVEKRRRKFIIAFQQKILINLPSRQFKAPLLAKYFERINHLTQNEVLLLSQLWISGYTDQSTRDIVTANTVLSVLNTRPSVPVYRDSP